MEVFSIAVASAIFIIFWNTRRLLDNNYFLFLGISYLFVAIISLAHTLAYKGMGVFPGYDANLPTQLWIAAHYMQSISFLVAPLLLGRKLKANYILIGYALITIVLLLSMFYWRIFPTCYIEGVGLTPFKKISEYIISAILLASLALLLRKRKQFDENVLQLLAASIALNIGAELAFTFYVSVYGISNLIGHLLTAASVYLSYVAFVEIGLTRPYNMIFRRLKKDEEALRALAMIDDLTGLYNRRGFITISEQRLKIANRTKSKLLLFYADLDGMKWINDRLGHLEGDYALIDMADVLRKTFRGSDVIARIGGDEFVVLAGETATDDVAIMLARLKSNLKAKKTAENRRYELSISIGMETYDLNSPCSIEELMERADKKMYQEKKAKGAAR